MTLGCREEAGAPADRAPWVEISQHPCAVDADGVGTCWHSEEWSFDGDARGETPLSFSVEPGQQILGRRALQAWAPGEMPEVVSCPWYGEAWSECSPSLPMAVYNSAFGITVDDELAITSSRIAGTSDRGWWAIDEGRSAIDANHVVYTHPFEIDDVEVQLPEGLVIDDFGVATTAMDPIDLEIDTAVFVLSGGDIERHDRTTWDHDDSVWYDYVWQEGPYVDLFVEYDVACALSEEGLLECNTGQLFDMGEVVDIEVQIRRTPSGQVRASACSLTTDNEIRCRGPHYPQDLQDQLDALPR